MIKLIVAVLIAFAGTLFGCSGSTQTDEDPLSRILYTQPAQSEDVYDTYGEFAELFDNISNDTAEDNMSVAVDISENTDLSDADKAEENIKEESIAEENETEHSKTENNKSEENVQAFSYSDADTVWIPASGKKYHSKPDCSGMKNPSAVSKSQAELEGYTACKRCF